MYRFLEASGLLEIEGWKGADVIRCVSVSAKQFYYLRRGMVVPNNELDLELKLGTALFNDKRFEFPWTYEAHCKVITIRNKFRNNQFTMLYEDDGLAIQIFVEELRKLKLENIGPTRALWGKTLAAFFFIISMRQSRQSQYVNIYTYDDLVIVTDILLRLLQTKPKHPWVVVLASIVDQIILAEKWHKVDSEGSGRCSEEMRHWLEGTRMRNRLIEYNDIVPFAHEAPFSALAIASRFKERENYRDLLERIKKAKRLGSLYVAGDMVLDDNDADEDFDDFRCWFAENQDALKEEALKKKKAA